MQELAADTRIQLFVIITRESGMSDNGGNNNGGLYMIVGALVVVVGLGAFLFMGGDVDVPSGGSTTTIERTITPNSDSTVIKKD